MLGFSSKRSGDLYISETGMVYIPGNDCNDVKSDILDIIIYKYIYIYVVAK